MVDSSYPTRTRVLLERYLAGDRESESRLFDRHRSELLARARRASWMPGIVRHTTPEDLVQETFVRALSSGMLRRFEDRGAGSLGRALEKVLGNVAVDVSRRHGSLKRGSGRFGLSLDADAGPDSELAREVPDLASAGTTPTAAARGRELVDLCRELLPPREWEVWYASEVERLDSVEVAARVQASPAAVRGVLHRARKRVLGELVRRESVRPAEPGGA